MGFQSSINQALAAGATVKAAKDLTHKNELDDKYALTGKLGSAITEKQIYLTHPNLSPRMKEKAFNHLRERLSTMADEARLTDMRERKARVLGIFPTKESKEIRAEGLQRKAANIEDARNALWDDLRDETEKKEQELGQKQRLVPPSKPGSKMPEWTYDFRYKWNKSKKKWEWNEDVVWDESKGRWVSKKWGDIYSKEWQWREVK